MITTKKSQNSDMREIYTDFPEGNPRLCDVNLYRLKAVRPKVCACVRLYIPFETKLEKSDRHDISEYKTSETKKLSEYNYEIMVRINGRLTEISGLNIYNNIEDQMRQKGYRLIESQICRFFMKGSNT